MIPNSIYFLSPLHFQNKSQLHVRRDTKTNTSDQDALRCWDFLSHRHTELESYNAFHCPLFIEYARACSTYHQILSRDRLLTGKLMIQ
jgi:hypothetical protein